MTKLVMLDFKTVDRLLKKKIRTSVNRQSPYGQEEWQHEVCRENGLESTIRPIGRPKRGGRYA